MTFLLIPLLTNPQLILKLINFFPIIIGLPPYIALIDGLFLDLVIVFLSEVVLSLLMDL